MADKKLPYRVYDRGEQGTFVYSPDVSVYVSTDKYGIIDMSRYLTSFSIQRNVNSPSTFSMTFDNKYARFDRVIRRMDRVVVFFKRIRWLQEFSGYVSVAPWETPVPGDAQLVAECTIKRLVYTYWDPYSHEGVDLIATTQGHGVAASLPDGGSGVNVFKLLTTIAAWDETQIQIQKIPDLWLAQVAGILQKAKDDLDSNADYQIVVQAVQQLLDADGWQGQLAKAQIDALLGKNAMGDKWLNAMGGGQAPHNGVDQDWYRKVGRRDAKMYPPNTGTQPEYFSGFVPHNMLTNSGVLDTSGKRIYLRIDAARALHDLMKQNQKYDINTSYLGFGPEQRLAGQKTDQTSILQQAMKGAHNKSSIVCERMKCPAGTSDHGWGTAIDFDSTAGSPPASVMSKYGWIADPTGDGGNNPNHWMFVGNYPDYPAYTTAAENPTGGHKHATPKSIPTNQFDWQGYEADTASDANTTFEPVFKFAVIPQFSTWSDTFTGKQAWINDVPLIEDIARYSGASMRDFQSAPNGDFIAFFPDRLGVYGKFPAVQIRNIEVVDFKLAISDRALVTHYVSVGDFTDIEQNEGVDLDALFNSGMVTVEQPEVMQILLGLPEDEVPNGLGEWILQRFGMRPRREDNYNILNRGYNYMWALHKFQEAWANQWMAMVTFTFMPEIYPGMRIELADFGIAVYVENVVHNGSRTGGFTTTATVSTPMRKQGDRWVLLKMEFDPTQFNITTMPEDVANSVVSAVENAVGDLFGGTGAE